MESQESSIFWLQMATETDALLVRGFLANRMYLNKLILDCSFVTPEEFKDSCLEAIHMETIGSS